MEGKGGSGRRGVDGGVQAQLGVWGLAFLTGAGGDVMGGSQDGDLVLTSIIYSVRNGVRDRCESRSRARDITADVSPDNRASQWFHPACVGNIRMEYFRTRRAKASMKPAIEGTGHRARYSKIEPLSARSRFTMLLLMCSSGIPHSTFPHIKYRRRSRRILDCSLRYISNTT